MPRACACNDFNRTELFRRAAATAGSGLPAIEPGMPLPAGTGLNRRTFLTRSAGLAIAVYGGSKLSFGALDERTVTAPANAKTLVDRALKFWNTPTLRTSTRNVLTSFAQRALADAKGSGANERTYPVTIENALRQLIAVSPDLQTS